jgi:hypothetical protein
MFPHAPTGSLLGACSNSRLAMNDSLVQFLVEHVTTSRPSSATVHHTDTESVYFDNPKLRDGICSILRKTISNAYSRLASDAAKSDEHRDSLLILWMNLCDGVVRPTSSHAREGRIVLKDMVARAKRRGAFDWLVPFCKGNDAEAERIGTEIIKMLMRHKDVSSAKFVHNPDPLETSQLVRDTAIQVPPLFDSVEPKHPSSSIDALLPSEPARRPSRHTSAMAAPARRETVARRESLARHTRGSSSRRKPTTVAHVRQASAAVMRGVSEAFSKHETLPPVMEDDAFEAPKMLSVVARPETMPRRSSARRSAASGARSRVRESRATVAESVASEATSRSSLAEPDTLQESRPFRPSRASRAPRASRASRASRVSKARPPRKSRVSRASKAAGPAEERESRVRQSGVIPAAASASASASASPLALATSPKPETFTTEMLRSAGGHDFSEEMARWFRVGLFLVPPTRPSAVVRKHSITKVMHRHRPAKPQPMPLMEEEPEEPEEDEDAGGDDAASVAMSLQALMREASGGAASTSRPPRSSRAAAASRARQSDAAGSVARPRTSRAAPAPEDPPERGSEARETDSVAAMSGLVSSLWM